MKREVWSGDVYELEEILPKEMFVEEGKTDLHGSLSSQSEVSIGLGMFESSEVVEARASRKMDEIVSAKLLAFYGQFVERASASWLMKVGVGPEESLVDASPESAERVVRVAASAAQALCGAAVEGEVARALALSQEGFVCAVRDGSMVSVQLHPRKNLGFVIGAFEELEGARSLTTPMSRMITQVLGEVGDESALERVMAVAVSEIAECEGVGLMWPSGDSMWLVREGERGALDALDRMSAAWLGSDIIALDQLLEEQSLEVIVVYEAERLIFVVRAVGTRPVFMTSCRRSANVGMAMARARRAAARVFEGL